MMNSPFISLYPKAGCLRVGRRLISIREVAFGTHLWAAIVFNRVNAPRAIYTCPREGRRCIFLRVAGMGGLSVPIISTAHDSPIAAVRQIQRAARAFLRRRFEARALALAMALHPRLGARSGFIADVPVDLFAMMLTR
jgi:hypothetical protein